MKSFRKLCVGDIIYMIPRNVRLLDTEDYYTNVQKSNLDATKVEVRNLYTQDNGNVLINWNGKSYSSDIRFDCLIPKDLLDRNICKDKDGNIYFSNIMFFERIAKALVLKAIKDAENKIKDTITHQNGIIGELRVKYYELLNPVACGRGEVAA